MVSSIKSRRPTSRGFTLIELMIVIVVVAILAAVAYPSYLNQTRKSRRSDAVQALAQVQQAQERWRANNATYGSLTNIGVSSASQGGYYTIAIATTPAPSGTGYVATATAVTGKSQAGDTDCTELKITVTNGSSVNTPAACWST